MVGLNNLEKIVLNLLKNENLLIFFKIQYPFLNFIIDFADPINQIAIEVQGTYWHGHILKDTGKFSKEKRKKDTIKRTELTNSNWYIIYIWEHSLENNPERVRQYLKTEIFKRIII